MAQATNPSSINGGPWYREHEASWEVVLHQNLAQALANMTAGQAA